MKRKQEEDLIRLAFGDVEEASSERANRLLEEDAEARRLFAGYAEMREGLKQLHTPEHQLSTERLRDAILRDGLTKERTGGSEWRWILAPFAVAAAAMFLTLRFTGDSNILPSSTNGGTVVMGPNAATEPSTPELRFAPSDVSDVLAQSEPNASRALAPTSPAATRAEARPRPDLPAPVASRPAQPKPELVASNANLTPAEISMSAIDGALPAGSAAIALSSGMEAPIVLIGAESDEATGANKATEVSSPSNVVIGG
jgi:hypothetical protein